MMYLAFIFYFSRMYYDSNFIIMIFSFRMIYLILIDKLSIYFHLFLQVDIVVYYEVDFKPNSTLVIVINPFKNLALIPKC